MGLVRAAQCTLGATAYVLLGTLPHSGRIRGVLAEKMDQAHLIEAMDLVMRRLGGTAHVWRTDRLATVITPGTGDVQPSFAPVAKHYGAIVEVPAEAREPQGLGRVLGAVLLGAVVANHDRGTRSRPRSPSTASWPRLATAVSAVTKTESGLPSGPSRTESRSWRCHGRPTRRRSVSSAPSRTTPPSPSGATATGAAGALRNCGRGPPPPVDSDPEIHALSGRLLSRHQLALAGAGLIKRTPEDHQALEAAVLAAFSTERSCDRKANRSPGKESLAEAARLMGREGREVVVDLARDAELAEVIA